ncbi:hypothetical protein A0H81_03135 [Grifola frondosa]|uniref:Uncharacterized protein n=1 Tax=Grifola frondosa TaxID=5627 RepID=A0A1C7MJF2_GRIFR|nr:hypothetical protein A0H81_03135 [Grifola frondosa]
MREADVMDKAEAKEKKREKKRKRKEREREFPLAYDWGSLPQGDDLNDEGDVAVGPTIAPLSDDGGYVSPEFDFPSDSEDERSDQPPPPTKRTRLSAGNKHDKRVGATTLAEEEELALQMLRRRQ